MSESTFMVLSHQESDEIKRQMPSGVAVIGTLSPARDGGHGFEWGNAYGWVDRSSALGIAAFAAGIPVGTRCAIGCVPLDP